MKTGTNHSQILNSLVIISNKSCEKIEKKKEISS